MACISVPLVAATVASTAMAASKGSPSQPNYGQTTAQTLQDQINLAPQQYAAESSPLFGQPAYAQLQLQNLNTMLHGTPGGPQTTVQNRSAAQTGWYDANGNFLSPGQQSGSPWGRGSQAWGVGANGRSESNTPTYVPGKAPAPGAVWRSAGDQFTSTATTNGPATPGIFSMVQQANTNQRANDIADVANLGPSATKAMLAADPYNAALLGKLNAQANSGLDAGSGLTPDQQAQMQQASRAAYAARGMGGSSGSVADELMKQFSLGQSLLQQRQAFAQSVLQNNQAVLGDPFQQILGRNSGAVAQAQQSQSQSGPALFNPQAGLGLASSNYAANAQMSAANNPMAQMGSMMTGLGNFTNGLSSAQNSGLFGGYCWVAREVYGVKDVRWLLFRNWLLNSGPRWLATLYGRFGERFAAWLRRHPQFKPVIRRLMDRAINRN